MERTWETLIQFYLNGKFPTSAEECLQIEIQIQKRICFWLEYIEASELEILRNKRMSAEMIRLMKENEGKGYFFAVGVAHLNYRTPKNPNILDHLQADGYHIERVAPEEILTAGSCRAASWGHYSSPS